MSGETAKERQVAAAEIEIAPPAMRLYTHKMTLTATSGHQSRVDTLEEIPFSG